jgi:hypothetical protein
MQVKKSESLNHAADVEARDLRKIQPQEQSAFKPKTARHVHKCPQVMTEES